MSTFKQEQSLTPPSSSTAYTSTGGVGPYIHSQAALVIHFIGLLIGFTINSYA